MYSPFKSLKESVFVNLVNQKCPCGSEKLFNECCAVYHNGVVCETPEQVMRSRYVAFMLNQFDYLKKTWHPETLPEDLGDDEPNNWIKLEIIECDVDEEDGEAEVEFKAYLIHDKKLEMLHECSYFEKIDGHWLYHSGEFLSPDSKAKKIKGADPCPCGSGKIFKNCHG